MYLDATTLQNPDPHVACSLVTIDKENLLAGAIGAFSPIVCSGRSLPFQ